MTTVLEEVVLVNGKIPANKECPFKEECITFQTQKCYHQGVNHPVEFSCGTARAFELLFRN
jgi:hypothetical protein